jgi:hypothetical protein
MGVRENEQVVSPRANAAMPGRLRFTALRLARTEFHIGARTAAFRLLALAAFLLGWAEGNAPGRGVAFSAYNTGEAAWQYMGFVAIIWMALAAVRDTMLRTDVLIYSKPQTTERLVLAKFLGGFAQLLAVLLFMFLGAMCGRLYVAGGLAGFPAYGVQYARAAMVLFFAGSASYCLALLADSAVAGALIGLYWVVMMAGKDFLAKIYFPAYTQNLPAYLFLAVFLLCIALWFYRRQRRGGAPASLWAKSIALVSLLAAGWWIRITLLNGHDPQAFTNPVLERMAQQNLVMDSRVPGFLLPDQHGRPVTLTGFPDRILVIGLWSPYDQESSLLLSRLNDYYVRYGRQGVQPIAICISEDIGAGSTFARGENLAYPVVSDWGTHNAPRQMDISPMADAYQASILPEVIVTDRRRRARSEFTGISAYDGAAVEQEIQRRLREEPE